MLHNVPAVKDAFLSPIRKNAKYWSLSQMWRNKAPTGVLCSPSRRWTKGSQAAKRLPAS